ncbi:hypothetical protein [Limosilactobacillus vaginalis]|uniref:hypothetical protein n=1 Tax=Limosilactobacillus vaginalis TaxID=1633 RepID=UPI0024B99691|nr:hypothetical protein [Limosilactobacillus vaginalis]
MELQDIKTIDDMKKQAEVYGVIAEQVADNLQDLKKLVAKKKNIDIYNELLDKLDKAQHELYQASIELANGED